MEVIHLNVMGVIIYYESLGGMTFGMRGHDYAKMNNLFSREFKMI